MIIINKSGYLKYKNLKFRCSYGRKGIKEKKHEGDQITPKGTFKIEKIYYRSDRIKKISCKLKLFKIKKNMGWCDDPASKNYNKEIKIPCKFSYEKMYRNDNVYDLILVLNYNINPIIKNKGSAIFIHVSKKFYQKTNGCIALKKKNLLKLIPLIKKNTKIKIS
jgi:L,D-peptidoglycan transpeptidase YkuD (ErfK/YbiS/YcfS/YnhG family)